MLDTLICSAYHQNLTLRQAGCRILEARAQLAIAAGNLFPQSQTATGDYTRNGISREVANGQFITQPFYSQWDFGFNLSWELDFWGRFRRAIEANAASLNASVEDYDETLVTLLGDVATNYVQMRTLEQRIEYTKKNVELQQRTVTIAEARFKGGTSTERDPYQARSTLEQTQAQIPELEISLRQTINQLCILLGIPPEALRAKLGPGPIPSAAAEVAVGIPADLLRRRPDVRRAEYLAAAQSAEIGVAEADFYPAVSINGTLGYSAERFSNLFQPERAQCHGRSVVSMERVELRTDPEQRPTAGRQVPGVGGGLSADGSQRQQGSRERAGDLPARPRAAPGFRGPGARCRKGGRDRAGPVRRGNGRFDARYPLAADPGATAGRAHASPGKLPPG